MSKKLDREQDRLEAAVNRVLTSTSETQVLRNLNQAVTAAKKLKKVPVPTAVNRSAGRMMRRMKNAERRFSPATYLYGENIVVLDADGVQLADGVLVEIRGPFTYEVLIGERHEVFEIGATDQFDVSPEGIILFGAHSCGDIA